MGKAGHLGFAAGHAEDFQELGVLLLLGEDSGYVTLYRMFASTTGQKPLEFIRSIRLKQAEELLLGDKTLSVQAVATLTGFASVSNFVKRFREMYGVNPSQIAQK